LRKPLDLILKVVQFPLNVTIFISNLSMRFKLLIVNFMIYLVMHQLSELCACFYITGVEYTKEQLQASKWNRIKNVFWNVMDRPTSSRLARVCNI
jgi:hypothetical protein